MLSLRISQVHDQLAQPCFPSYTKHFYKWRPDPEDLFSLQLHRCNVLFQKFQKNFCFVPFAHAQSTFESKSAYLCLSRMHNTSKSGFSKFRNKSFGYSWEKSERHILLSFSGMTKSGPLRSGSIFLDHPIDFHDFQE